MARPARLRDHRHPPARARPASPATTSSCSASAARARPACSAPCRACSTSGRPSSPAPSSASTRTSRSPPRASARAGELGDALPVAWRHRDDRYVEKLATPDTSVADLIGDVDPMKVAEGRSLGDPETIHFGLIPRSHRGIVAINELPDLAERIQVAMLNVMEERDVQIRGYVLRLPLDVLVVASANPEDYTNRGRIITPLKDRFGAEIRTHYPIELDDEIAVIRQEAELDGRGARRPRRDPRPLHPGAARVERGRPAQRRERPVRDRRRRDGRRRGRAPRGPPGRGRGRRPADRPRDRGRRARRQDRVRVGRGGPRRRGPRPPAPHRHRRDRARAASAGSTSRCSSSALDGGIDGDHGRAGRRPATFLEGLPSLGESDLYDAGRASGSAPRTTASAPARSSSPSRASSSRAASARSPAGAKPSMARQNRRLTRDTRYGRYAGGPDPLAPPADLRRGARRHRRRTSWPARRPSARCGSSCAAAAGPARPRRPRPPRRREAPRADEQRTTSTAPCSRSASCSTRRVLAERGELARDVELDDGDRALAEMQLDSLPPSPAAAVSELGELRLDEPRRPARSTRRSRTCSAASCSTSASPA